MEDEKMKETDPIHQTAQLMWKLEPLLKVLLDKKIISEDELKNARKVLFENKEKRKEIYADYFGKQFAENLEEKLEEKLEEYAD
ncbi:MAG: hypothetical protein ABIH76_00640 [Candidatus Bathyarchaeota archaeon]